MDKDVGRIKVNCKHMDVQWEIDDYFTSVPQTVDTRITSPNFHFAETRWYLTIEPNGCSEDEKKGWFAISLNQLDENELSLDLNFGIITSNFEECSELITHSFDSQNNSMVCYRFIESNTLYKERRELVPGDRLTLFCRASMSSKKKDSISTLSEDLKNLFINETNYDATIKVKDKSFHVHKVILGSRSPVLHAMFEHDMKENNSGTVNIEDCEPEFFYDFLLFLYSEKTDILSPKNAVSLYYLADKYFLRSLKELCLDFMLKNLNVDNIFEVVTLADRHHEEQLMETVSNFFKNNLKDIIRNDKWVNFNVENTLLATELLKKAIP